MANKVRPSCVTNVTRENGQKTPKNLRHDAPTKRSSTSYRPSAWSSLRRVRSRIHGTYHEELLPRDDDHLKHPTRFPPEGNSLRQFRFPRRLYALVFGEESGRASQAAVVVEGEREHCVRISWWMGDSP